MCPSQQSGRRRTVRCKRPDHRVEAGERDQPVRCPAQGFRTGRKSDVRVGSRAGLAHGQNLRRTAGQRALGQVGHRLQPRSSGSPSLHCGCFRPRSLPRFHKVGFAQHHHIGSPQLQMNQRIVQLCRRRRRVHDARNSPAGSSAITLQSKPRLGTFFNVTTPFW